MVIMTSMKFGDSVVYGTPTTMTSMISDQTVTKCPASWRLGTKAVRHYWPA